MFIVLKRYWKIIDLNNVADTMVEGYTETREEAEKYISNVNNVGEYFITYAIVEPERL